MEKSLVPYKKSIFRKIVDLVKGKKDKKAQMESSQQLDTINRFKNQIKIVDKYSEERKLTDMILTDSEFLTNKTDNELNEIENKLLKYLYALQDKVKEDKKGIKNTNNAK